MSASSFRTPFGEFILSRHPARKDEKLKAWCAADLLLLEEAFKLGLDNAETLVTGDRHGALCTAFAPLALWSDSALSAAALRINEAKTGRAATEIFWSTQAPPHAVNVLLRVPKQLDYLKYQLSILAECMPENGILIASGMDKHLSPHTAALLEQFIGPTKRHRGSRKARIFTSRRLTQTALFDKPNITSSSYSCPPLMAPLEVLPNVFSPNSLDLGTRLLLEYLPRFIEVNGVADKGIDQVLDLACGSGVIGLVAHHSRIASRTVFCDESALAVESARSNANRLFPNDSARFLFHHGDGLTGIKQLFEGESAQAIRSLVLCNPPFHLDHTVDDFVGRRLITQAGTVLKKEDSLLLVANRHLGYIRELKRLFGSVQTVAEDRKFKLFLAQK